MPSFALPPMRKTDLQRVLQTLKNNFPIVGSQALNMVGQMYQTLRDSGMLFHYDCLKQVLDPRDYTLPKLGGPLAPVVDFRAQCSPIENQGPYGSCTGQGTTGVIELLERRAGDYTDKSRMFIYWWARYLDTGSVTEDKGATVRSALKAANKYGAPQESIWPYIQPNLYQKPTDPVMQDALQHTITAYYSIPDGNLEQILQALSSGYPIVLAMDVFPEFESVPVMKTGIVPMPSRGERSIGGHCIDLVGYDLSKNWVVGRNSWGEEWGDHGYFYLPFDYVEAYTWDAWAVTAERG
jgi:C1A family cysteine protease